MSLPTINDYHLAVQNPEFCFSDPDLKAATVELRPQGTPWPRSGGFAVTYRLFGQAHSWAVRCFHRETPDLQARYADISSYLGQKQPERFLEFDYQPNGINVGGEWFPIVKMDWKSAVPLDTYLDNLHGDPNTVRELREEFVAAVSTLESLGVAHGDLQHGNMLIDANWITFVDYDGMYVPGMAATTSNERGHVNYQSPLRTGSDFGPHLDRFSAMSIALALEALAHKPDLWSRYGYRENLIFIAKDYVDPNSSPILQELQRIPALKDRVEQFVLACRTPLEQLPNLSDFLSGENRITTSQAVTKFITRTQLYQHPVLDVLDDATIRANMGNVVQIVGRITQVKRWTAINGRPMAFVNFSHYRQGRFFIVVWEEVLEEFRVNRSDIADLESEWITVVGLVEEYQGRPQIVPKSMRDFRVLPRGRHEAKELLDAGLSSVSIPALTQAKTKNAQVLETIQGKPTDTRSERETSSAGVPFTPSSASGTAPEAKHKQSTFKKSNREIVASLQKHPAPNAMIPGRSGRNLTPPPLPPQTVHTQHTQPYVAPKSFGTSNAGCIVPLVILIVIILLIVW
jgi:serine/threonine protein kinase